MPVTLHNWKRDLSYPRCIEAGGGTVIYVTGMNRILSIDAEARN